VSHHTRGRSRHGARNARKRQAGASARVRSDLGESRRTAMPLRPAHPLAGLREHGKDHLRRMRESGVSGILIYCSDFGCGHSQAGTGLFPASVA
jgi:hypothetical protein